MKVVGNSYTSSYTYSYQSSLLPQEPSKRVSIPPLYHMGHSHAHHHHDHHDHSESSSSKHNAKSLTPKEIRALKRRRIAMALFCFLATMGPNVLRRRLPTKSDVFCLGLSLVVMSSVQTIRRSIMHRIATLKEVGDAIFKHSSVGSKRAATTKQAAASMSLDTSEADRVTWIGVVVNLVLSIGKLGVGVMAHSSALIADAGHSLSDLVSDFITLWSVQIARLPPDDDHPLGHYKFEAIGSLFLSLTLLATGFSVGGMAYKQLLQVLATGSAAASGAAAASSVPLPGPLALVMAGLSIASKEWLYRITKKVGEKLKSPVVIANAWHHRSDAYSSVLALLSIAWAMAGFRAADAAAGLLVAGMICMTGGDILVESVQQLSDSADEGLSEELHGLVDTLEEADDDILSVTSQSARQVGSSAFVDVTVETSPDLTTTATLAVEERFKEALVQAFSDSGRHVTATVHAKPNLVLECPLLGAVDDAACEPEEEEALEPTTMEASTSSLGEVNGTEESATSTPSSTTAMADEPLGTMAPETDATPTTTKKTEPLVSASQIEFLVRQRALLLHPQQTHYNIQSVFVHYLSTRSVMVDITLESIMDVSSPSTSSSSMSNDNDTVRLSYLQEQAKDLQQDLEGIPEIQQAKISLDLLTADSREENGSNSDNDTAMPSPLVPPESVGAATASLWSSADPTSSSSSKNSSVAP